MSIEFLTDVFAENADAEAIAWRGDVVTYGWLLDRVNTWRDTLAREGVSTGTVVALEADFSPNSVAAFLALVDAGAILVPLTSSVAAKRDDFLRIAEVEFSIAIGANDKESFERLDRTAGHEFYATLRERKSPGLVLFSSGSTGESKAALHDLAGILEKFKVRRKMLRSISFLLFDHIGGVNTMFYTLSNAGCMVTVQDRSPDAVLEAVAKYRVELLPTSPTFINLILLSEAHKRHDVSSLQTVTYGTEPMPQSTLDAFHSLFPDIRMQQTYGLSEVGILRSKSKSSDSLWVKVGGEGFQTRIVDGILHIKAESAMIGYLNAPSPFTDDGWFVTGDSVEQDGEYLRILGRKSELINVGGEKVYPTEVESVIQQMDEVAEVTVFGEAHPLTGQIVCARVKPAVELEPKALTLAVKKYCRGKMERFKIPVKVLRVEDEQHSARFKKMRRA